MNKLYYNLDKAINYYELNQLDAAEEIILKLVEEDFSNPEVILQLVKIYFSKQRYNDAEKYLREIINYYSTNSELTSLLALILKKQGKLEEAKKTYEQALELNLNNYEASYNLGVLYHESNDIKTAIKYYKLSILTNQNNSSAYYNLGNTYRQLKNYKDAIYNYRKAIRINSGYENAHYNLGVVYAAVNRYENALKEYQKTIKINPSNIEAHWNRALLLLLLGRYKQGWEEYQWRLNKPGARRHYNNSQWKGENLEGKTIFIYGEQGLGDIIQFLRYVHLIKNKGARVIFECRSEIVDLLRDENYIDKIVIKNENFVYENEFDYFIPLLSLPNIFNTELNNIPTNIPYITVQNKLKQHWGKVINNTQNLKIGFLWAGNPNPLRNRKRHAELKYFLPLLNIKNTKWFGLQYGEAASEFEKIDFPPVNFQEDFVNTAAIIKNLDLVITIDTVIAHIAGALGKETFVLLDYEPDWRWLLERNDSPWYPAVRLFRQKEKGNWETVFKELETVLKKKVEPVGKKDGVYLSQSLGTKQGNNQRKSITSPKINYVSTIDQSLINRQAVAYFQKKNCDNALKLFQQILENNPDDFRTLNNIGLVYQEKKELEIAVDYYKKAIAQQKNYMSAYINLAAVYYALNRYNDSENILNEALLLDENNSEINYNLAVFYHKQKILEKAKRYYKQSIQLDDKNVKAMNNLALLYLDEEQYQSAKDILFNASQINPEFEETYFNLGNVFKENEEYDKAIENYLASIKLNNQYLDAYINLGNTYFYEGKLQSALDLFFQLDNTFPSRHKILYNIGIINYELGDLKRAKEYLRKAILIHSDNPEYHSALAEILLTEGEYQEGWDEYEWRLKKKWYKNLDINLPNNPEDMKGGKILVYSEQGIGDNFNFIRYLKYLNEQDAEIDFVCREEIFPLLKYQDYFNGITKIDNSKRYNYKIPLLSLPKILNNITIPKQKSSYLKVDKNIIAKWYKLIRNNEKKKIGLVWSGKNFPIHNRKRHVPVEYFLLLTKAKDADYYSLQKDYKNQEEKFLLSQNGISDLSENLTDFNVTAAIIENLDLVITVDTAVAHLSGALMKKTWLLLPLIPDWRWGLKGTKSIWYPTITLFRQTKRGNWDALFEEILNHLKNM